MGTSIKSIMTVSLITGSRWCQRIVMFTCSKNSMPFWSIVGNNTIIERKYDIVIEEDAGMQWVETTTRIKM